MPKNVFISYVTADIALVEILAHALSAAGFDVFQPTQQIRPGDTWTERIAAAIGSADVILFVLSPHSSLSEFSRVELALAVSAVSNSDTAVIMPVIAERPIELPFFLRHLQYIDLSRPEYHSRGIPLLIEAIATAGEGPSRDAQASARRQVLEISSQELRMDQEVELVRLMQTRLILVMLLIQTVFASAVLGVGAVLVIRDPDGVIGWTTVGSGALISCGSLLGLVLLRRLVSISMGSMGLGVVQRVVSTISMGSRRLSARLVNMMTRWISK